MDFIIEKLTENKAKMTISEMTQLLDKYDIMSLCKAKQVRGHNCFFDPGLI